MNNTIKDFKNGLGYVYITKADGTSFVQVFPNTPQGGADAQAFVYLSAPLAGNISATGKVSLTGGAGTITSITVNGVNVLGSTATGATLADLAADAVSKINTYASTPEYTAVVSGTDIIIQAEPSAGSGPNSYAVAAAVTGTVAYTTENMSGGTDTQGLIDTSYGYRAFLNADYDADGCAGEGTADPTALTNAIEITKYLVNRGFQTSFIEKNVTIIAGTATVERESSTTILYLSSETGVSDQLDSIPIEGFNQNDLIIIKGNGTDLITIPGGTGNITTANTQSFSTADGPVSALCLRLINSTWYEEFRSPFNAISVSFLRALNIAIPVQGVNTTALPTNGTITLTPGTDKEYQVYNGSPTLVGSVVIDAGGSPLDGDHFWVKYEATPVTGVNTVTIFGITLTDSQAQSGAVTVYAEYDDANSIWKASIIQEANGVTFSTTGQLSAAVKTFVFVDASNTTTGADEVMYTYNLPANTLVNDGDYVRITGLFRAVNNANTKTMQIEVDGTTCAQITGAINNEYCSIVLDVNKIDSQYQLAHATDIRTNVTTVEYNKLAKDVTNVIPIDWIVNAATAVNDIRLVYIKVEFFGKQ